MNDEHFFSELPASGQRLLGHLAHLPAPFDGSTADAAAGTAFSPLDTDRLINELTLQGALEVVGVDPERGRLYTILTDAARTHDPAAAGRVVARYLDYTVACAHAASTVLTPHRTGLDYTARHGSVPPFDPEGSTDRATAWLLATLPALSAALDAAEHHGEHQAGTNLVYCYFPALHRTRPRAEGAAVFRRGLALAEAWGNPQAILSMHATLATFLRNVPGGTDEAICHNTIAMELATAAGDHRAAIRHRRSIAACHNAAENHEAAVKALDELLPQYDLTTPEDRRDHMLALILLGSSHSSLGNYPVAIRHLTQCLDTHETLLRDEDPLNQGRARAYLGQAYGLNGQYTASLVELDRAGLLFRDLGVPLWIAHTLEMLGSAAGRAGHTDAEQDYLTRAHAAYGRLGALADMERVAPHLTERRHDAS
ncbi:tetratricopeptide repeat protein [Kitasatospora griseola]|uniref:tetratricopeptide repeat protein n=1 Tax=Kitasatospora griseola TaxID=2064 RepID=UPI0034252E07